MKRNNILVAFIGICLLWIIRIIISQQLLYGFIITNVILATIPLLIEPLFPLVSKQMKGFIRRLCHVFLAVVWILFLPNAFYLLTDMMHLNPDVLVNGRDDGFRHGVDYSRGDGLFVFDSFFLFTATAFGAYVGGIALLHAYRFLSKKVSRSFSLVVATLLMLLVGIGVYIGRYGRWNSWEGLFQPHRIIYDLYQDLLLAQRRERFLLVVVTILLLELVILWCVWQASKSRGNAKL